MRNYELINEIYKELKEGNGKGSFKNPYLNTVIAITRLIEEERPEMKDTFWKGGHIEHELAK